MQTLTLSNIHADRVGYHIAKLGRAWRVVRQDMEQYGIAVIETDASRTEVAEAMSISVDVVGDQCSAIDWHGGAL